MKSSLGKMCLLVTLIVILGIIKPYPAFADDSTADIEKRLNDLEAQVADLKQELWKQKQEKAKNPPQAIVTANSKDGFSIKSPDGNYSLKIGGYAQVVAREFGTNGNNQGYGSSIIPRRVRLIIQGTVAHDF